MCEIRLNIYGMKASEAPKQIAFLEAHIEKKRKIVKGWESWFSNGGEDDIARPVSGRETLENSRKDILAARREIEEIKHQVSQVEAGVAECDITWLYPRK